MQVNKRTYMIYPAYLEKGDKVAIVSPSGKIRPQIIERGAQLLDQQGFQVIIGKHARKAHHNFAGTDQERLHDLQEMLDHKEIKAIFCARGGYGSLRIISRLNFQAFQKHPKWLIGFSDITVLHAAIQHHHIASIHGAMPKTWYQNDNISSSFEKLISLLKGELPSYHLPAHALNIAGETEGIVTGGNLSLLYALNGTPYEPDYQDKIMFIEDLSEYIYHIERMLINFELRGVFQRIRGLVVGQFTDIKDQETPFGESVERMIHRILKPYHIPLLFHFPAGHDKTNLPLIIGGHVRITAGNENHVIFR